MRLLFNDVDILLWYSTIYPFRWVLFFGFLIFFIAIMVLKDKSNMDCIFFFESYIAEFVEIL